MRYLAIGLVLILFFSPASVKPIRAQDTQQAVAAVKPAQAAPATPAAGNTATGASGAASNPGSAAGQNQTPPQNPLSNLIWPLILVMVVFYVFMFSGKNRDEKKRKAMLATMKRGDRVVTMGGLIASVVDVRDDEVVLK